MAFFLHVEIARQDHHVANGDIARTRQDVHDRIGYIGRLDDAAGLLGLAQILLRPVGQQGAVDGTGRDRGNTDAVFQDLAAYGLDEAGHGPLGGSVDRLPGNGEMPGYRAGHHDVADATLDHVRQDVMDVLHYHADVEAHHPVDGVRIGIEQLTPDVATGIGVEDIELPCLLQDL